jgi:mannan endo-1,4-beta-mannosidase
MPTYRCATLVAVVVTGLVTMAGGHEVTPASAAGPPRTFSALREPVTLGSHVAFGAAVPDLPAGRTDLPGLERTLSGHLQIASSFVDWSYVPGGANELWAAHGGTRDVLLSWEPFGVRFTDVTTGMEDGYLRRVAASMLAYPYDVYVRPWPEMNAAWSSWQPTAEGGKPQGGTPKQFIAAWRYLVTFFRSRGVQNLKFVFNPDSSNGPANTPVPSIWPGADVVDVVGIDGYNWGTDDVGDHWRSFASIFSGMYTIVTTLDGVDPVWITETGCKEPAVEDDWRYPQESAPVDPSNSKGTWIRHMMSSTLFPAVKVIVWFNKQKERDWRLQSSGGALRAIRAALP